LEDLEFQKDYYVTLVVLEVPSFFVHLTEYSDLKEQTDRYIHEAVHSLTDPILCDLPRKIRDIIYQELCGISEEPFYVVDNNSMLPSSDEYCSEPLIENFDLPYWMDLKHVGEEFTAETTHIWYKNARLIVDVKLLSSLMHDVGGVLVGSGATRMRARELTKSLDIHLCNLPACWKLQGALFTSDKAAPYHRAARELATLLGPAGMKYKQGFKLRLVTPPSFWPILQRYAETVGPIVELLRGEGFVVTVVLGERVVLGRLEKKRTLRISLRLARRRARS
jgi:hypothetical protein